MDEDLARRIREEVERALESKTLARNDEVRKIVRQTVAETLVRLGLDHDDPIEMQRDMQHVRRWRMATESLRQKGFLTAMGISITGAAGLLWLGFQQIIGKA